MKPTLSVYDDVLENPDEIRGILLRQDFKPFDGVDGGSYQHTTREPSFSELFTPVLSRITGASPVFRLDGWRLDLAGEESDNHCHADSVYDAEWACVYYMVPNSIGFGGTAFWRHRLTQTDRLPSDALIQAAGHDLAAWHTQMTLETLDSSKWELAGNIAMRYNRLIIYPTRAWHSRTPAAGFGTNAENGRLVGVGFFDV